jgi:periplasmic divalent cation tolerance protein
MFVVQTTVKTRAQAQRIGSALVREGLSACASFWKVESVFFWEGKMRKETEWALELKCAGKNYARLSARLKKLHPYSLPQLLAFSPAKAGREFSAWVEKGGG